MSRTIALVVFFGLLAEIFTATTPNKGVVPLFRRVREVETLVKRASGETVALAGSIGTSASFFANVGVGSPAQNFFVQVDTGITFANSQSTKIIELSQD